MFTILHKVGFPWACLDTWCLQALTVVAACRRFILYLSYSLMAFVIMTFVRVGVNTITTKPPQEVSSLQLITAQSVPIVSAPLYKALFQYFMVGVA